MNIQVSHGPIRNLLITGADQEERMKYATSLSKHLLCRQHACGHCSNCLRIKENAHPNVLIIEPLNGEQEGNLTDTAEIKIDQIRRLIEESSKANYEEGLGIFIVTHMHQLTKSAANALLKVLEENSQHKVFLALAPSRISVLPTIASRLTVMPLKPLKIIYEYKKEILDLFNITNTPPKDRFYFVKDFPKERMSLITLLEMLIHASHDQLRAYDDKNHELYPGLNPTLALAIIQALETAMTNCQKNANPTLVVENMLFHQWPYV